MSSDLYVGGGSVIDLFIYPIKGLTGQSLDETYVTKRGFPFDRVAALARRDGNFQGIKKRRLTEDSFRELYSLLMHERLAGVTTELDPYTNRLVVQVQGRTVLDCVVDTEAGLASATQLFANVLDLEARDRPLLVWAGSHYNFGWPGLENRENTWACHIVNMASVRELETRIGQPIDPRRFRANVYVDMGEPWVEREWVGATFAIGDVAVRCIQQTVRCAVTEVNPDTALRDIPLPRLLMQHYGNTEFGVYANVLTPGKLRRGMPVTNPGHRSRVTCKRADRSYE
ncbi:MOSC domain-containing protein [Rhodococcus ruber]|uniref:MOSC domain-containing protein n=1 Tax=Rhodococcus ruber TaxID=1830 RepID=UPI003B21A43B